MKFAYRKIRANQSISLIASETLIIPTCEKKSAFDQVSACCLLVKQGESSAAYLLKIKSSRPPVNSYFVILRLSRSEFPRAGLNSVSHTTAVGTE